MEKIKNKNKLIKRMGALLCALIVAVSSMGASANFYASVSAYYPDGFPKDSLFFEIPSDAYSYKYIACFIYYDSDTSNEKYRRVFCSDSPFSLSYSKHSLGYLVSMNYDRLYFANNGSETWHVANYGSSDVCDVNSDCIFLFSLLYSNSPIYDSDGSIFADAYDSGGDSIYDSSLGYLQNVRMHTVFDDVPLGETTGEKWTSRWYYDQYSTTGIDLTSGDYMINYYQERWVVKGYGKDDVVEKSDRYLLGTYIVQNGYIETYSEDIESTLQGQGYEEPSILDLLWNKFITTHYYFQIVDAKNNQVGGVLHIYLTDDNGKFGVEHIGETLDDKGEYDDGGYKDFIEDDSITTDDVEGGFAELESGSSVDIGTIDGVDEFSYALESIALEINNVSNAMQQVLYMLPPWILTVLSVSFAMMVTLVVLAFIRG